MDFWFSEMHTRNVKISIRVEKQLFSGTSDFQRIDVFESEEFGRFLTSDGSIIFSEKDEFTYDEMIVHVPMAVHPHVKKVLVIGGGRRSALLRLLTFVRIFQSIDGIRFCLRLLKCRTLKSIGRYQPMIHAPLRPRHIQAVVVDEPVDVHCGELSFPILDQPQNIAIAKTVYVVQIEIQERRQSLSMHRLCRHKEGQYRSH